MSKEPPRRWKAPEDFDVGEHVEHLQARCRGSELRVETPEYRRRKVDALRSAGLDQEADEYEPDPEPDPERETVADVLQEIRRR